MQTTTNYGYNVPESGDAADITKVAQNFVDIDSDLKEVADTVNNTCSDLSGKIDEVGTKVDGVGTKVDSIQTTVDTLPEKVEQKLDPVQTDMAQLVENVQKQVDDLRTIVENSPSGVIPPCLSTISSSSNDNGIAISYKAYTGTNAQGAEPNSMNNWPIVVTKGVMVRYSSEKYPENINDGTLGFIDEDLFEVGEDGTKKGKSKSQTVAGLTSEYTYYFTAFTYSNYGVYNESMSRLNCTKCQWTGTKGTLTVNVTQDHDYKPLGEYTATLTPTAGGQAITKTQSGAATIVFSGLEAGEYTLSFSDVTSFTKPQNQSVTVVSGQSQTISAQYNLNVSLSSLSWAEINEYAQIGVADQLFSVGDTKDVIVNGETLTFEIVGFNHDDLADGSGKAGITFGMKNLMANTREMNNSNTNANGYTGTSMYSWLTKTFQSKLPSELKAVIKTIKKKTSAGNYSQTIETYSMKLFLFSEVEVFGYKSYAVAGEGSIYSIFSTSSKRAKKINNGSGAASNWWLRSPDSTRPTNFCYVNSEANPRSDYALNTYGVCVGFCV